MILGPISLILGYTYENHSFSRDTIDAVGFFGVCEVITELIIIVDILQ